MIREIIEKINFFTLIDYLESILDKIFITIIIFLVGFFLIKIVNMFLDRLFKKTKFDVTLEQFLDSLINWSLWIILVVVILNHVGVDTTPILASLSIVGFISGFALKDVLSNLAAGMLILASKPFKVGDFIKSGDISGTVEKIRTASCVLRTVDNIKISVPNNLLWGNPIINYSSYPRRRIEIKVGVSYNHKISKVLKTLEKIVKSNKKILKEPVPEYFVSELGDYTLNAALRCWTKREDYFDVLYELHKDIKEEFEKAKIEMPNPTMDVYVKK